MTKERIPLKGGDEFDALSGWKHYYSFKAGARKKIKRKYVRRLRRILGLKDQKEEQ